MSIITISRGSYSRGKEVAKELGYELISRDIVLEASEHFNIPEIKLIRAIHDSPSVLDRFTYGKERYVSYIRAALLKHVQKDNVVYHGLAGHFLLGGIPHLLKVRIIADLEDRIKEEMRRENISAEKARYILKKDDDERRKWSLQLYGIDTWDPSLYDMVLHIKNITAQDAANIIVDTIKLPCFQTTPESRQIVSDLALAAQIQAVLVEQFPSISVSAKDNAVLVDIKTAMVDQKDVAAQARRIAKNVAGIEVEVTVQYLMRPEIVSD
jgi:cytidylate kinase